MVYLPHRYVFCSPPHPLRFNRCLRNHEATPISPPLTPASAPKSNSLGLSVTLLIAFSNSSSVNGVSCEVTCFESCKFGISMPLSCCESFVLSSAGSEGTAVGWSEREAGGETLVPMLHSATQQREMGRRHTVRSTHAQYCARSYALLPTRARRTVTPLRVLVLYTLHSQCRVMLADTTRPSALNTALHSTRCSTLSLSATR